MENTIENKARFFSLYLGQMISYPDIDDKIKVNKLVSVGFDEIQVNYKRKIKGCSGDILSFNYNGNHNCNALSAKLILTDIKNITDDDTKLLGYQNSDEFFLKKCLLIYDNWCDNLSYKNVDILRTKGYALPYLDSSIEQLLEYGWIELK